MTKMTKSYILSKWKPRLFRSFVTNAYYDNRDEYVAVGQQHPYTFEEYYVQNKQLLREQFRASVRGRK